MPRSDFSKILPRNDKPDGLHRTHASPTIGEVVRASEPEGCQTNETDCIYETLTPLSFAPLSSSPIVGEPRDTDCHVGLRPPRNDKIGTAVFTMSLRGFEEAVAISGKYRQSMQRPKDCHGRIFSKILPRNDRRMVCTAPMAPLEGTSSDRRLWRRQGSEEVGQTLALTRAKRCGKA